ncbi:MAG: hypothetical protein E7B53_14240 [Clostridium sp.]|uniref:hypothetical protein n=1 Tax=Clostridium sp. TaxID=1506 RepID=UPI0028FE46D3|nr:hypothetical protein [Clostridium sp.]MDU2895698.1 hypothetical protein [Clostridium sp.]MDU3008090.1 hypothetical protein [Clostridium sp.]MDU3037961.1 hypothetical protein [Clostridium sp.]MDU3052923.1 hypothetical protein [Clostridium sp.]
MDIIQEFKQDYENKYKINDNLLQQYKNAYKEYATVKSKYSNTLDELNCKLRELREKVQILTDAKVEFEKNLNFAAADKKQKEIQKIISDINKISDRSKTVEETLKNKGGEIKEKADKLMDIVRSLSVDADRKYTDAFADFSTRREEYNRKIQDEIPQILSPLCEMIWEFRRLKGEMNTY